MNPLQKIAEFIVAELDHFQANFRPQGGALTFAAQMQLKGEPFVGYVRVNAQRGQETKLLICRHYIPSGLAPSQKNSDYASYFSPLGQIIAKRPGQKHAFEVRHRRTGLLLESHSFELLEKDEFRSRLSAVQWDAVENHIAWVGGKMFVRSLRGLLRGEAERPIVREFRYTVQLPDQAILDEVQDEIFRLPFNSCVRISGAPGTGKTTVLLKRLSQKTKRDFLSEEEGRQVSTLDWQEGRSSSNTGRRSACA
ncbi:MAG TPA: hypothetical protein VMP11_03740 [Verrucomicrobiae bacterium]|nr:hypothetical protein [Verrucomicrobiae bacterium]